MACLPEPPAYAELFALSNFSFQRGASHPQELVARAVALGYSALALTDECSVAGVVRAHVEARMHGLPFLPGASFAVPGGTLVVLPHSLAGWGHLCEFITAARRSAPKGRYRVTWPDPRWASLQQCEVLLAPRRAITFEALHALLTGARSLFDANFWLAVVLRGGAGDALWLHTLQRASQHSRVPLVAAGEVLMHVRSRKPLQDVITAVGQGRPVRACGFALQPNAEAHLRSRQRLAALYPAPLLASTGVVASRCRFSLDALRSCYDYPQESLLPHSTPAQTLRHHALQGLQQRYAGQPAGVPPAVRQQVEDELALIAELKYEMYFLTVHDLVRFARSRDILCQGRGSAANSAVCYSLGITEVDPASSRLLFARFISRERNEPPDIDVDFEHDRREEVIQYIYDKYGRNRAALAAVAVSYRSRSAILDVARALGADDTHAAALADTLQGFPRHLSQHPGGFVLTHGPLTRLVPIENAAMPERSIIQWDKDDLDAVGLLKVDVLALGMLSAIRRCLALVGQQPGAPRQMQDIPRDDQVTYDMICAADTVGVFQIESRAQMSMLPRLRPRCFYDLVIEVAIVRPGPIQGGMVHPYLRRRHGLEPVEIPPGLEPALERTKGIPIFQEQVMQVAMIAADFSADEADQLRRSMAAWKRGGNVHQFHDRLVHRMVAKGYAGEFAERIFQQILGFGEYGFPESHAASFAQLVYVSCWLKRHHPDCFLVALLNSQPMGFYQPAQLVQDAQRHGVQVLPVDVMHSDWDSTLASGRVVRLGLHLVKGLGEPAVRRLMAARAVQAFDSSDDLARRAALDARDLTALAAADALASLSGHRRQQAWDAAALRLAPPLLASAPVLEDALALQAAGEGEEVLHDYASVGLTLRSHPLLLLRPVLSKMKHLTALELRGMSHGSKVSACGIVTMRQQPPTAKGVVFVTLEDETGTVNVIVWKALRERQGRELLGAKLLAVQGEWQRDESSGGEVRHLIASRLQDLTPLLQGLRTRSRDFH